MSGGLIPEPEPRLDHVIAEAIAYGHPGCGSASCAADHVLNALTACGYVVVRAEGFAHGDTLHQTLRPGLATLWRRVEYPT